LVDGNDTSDLSDRELSSLRGAFFGFVYQRFFLLDQLTAVQNVELALVHGSRWGRRRRRQAALDALDRVGLADRAEHRPAELSGGEQQRTAIARAVARTPKVVLADEPTGALDERTAEDTVGWLLELCREAGAALVVVTHDKQVAARMAVTQELSEGRWTQ
jgi:putative ABC transport system ATP-binding protein